MGDGLGRAAHAAYLERGSEREGEGRHPSLSLPSSVLDGDGTHRLREAETDRRGAWAIAQLLFRWRARAYDHWRHTKSSCALYARGTSVIILYVLSGASTTT